MNPLRPLTFGPFWIASFLPLLLCSTLTWGQKPIPAMTSGFLKNAGQVKAREGGKATHVLYVFASASADADVYITDRGISYVYKKLLDKKSQVIRKRPNGRIYKGDSATTWHFSSERIDASLLHAHIDTSQAAVFYSPGTPPLFNYYDGQKEITRQRLIQKIVFKNVYPGIDWVLRINEKGGPSSLKYDFIIHKGGRPENIKIAYSSNVSLEEKDNGIAVSGRLGFIKEGSPLILLKDALSSYPISYKVEHNRISYKTPAWPTTYPYTIDPDLYWGTFLHSTLPYDGLHYSTEEATDVTVDGARNIFVIMALAGAIQFPTVNPGGGAYFNDVYDSKNGSTLYMKFNEAGVLLWSTYFNSGNSLGNASGHIIADSKGNLIAYGGYMGSPPIKNNGGFSTGLTASNGAINDKYLAKFDNNGVLLWCTPFSYVDLAVTDITVDVDDNFYLAGFSEHIALPLKNPGGGAYFVSTPVLGHHMFVSKFDSQCNLVWSTDIAGNDDDDEGTRISVDKNKNIYILGHFVRSNNYPLVNAGGYFQSSGESVLTKFDAGYRMVWSTYLPGFAYDVTTDPAGNVYEVGQGVAAGTPYPYVNPGGAYIDPGAGTGGSGGNIMEFDANTNLYWSTTYHEGRGMIFEYAVFEEYRGLLHIYGYMNDLAYDVPTVNDPCNGSYYFTGPQSTGSQDPILLIFTPGGRRLYASFNAFPYEYYFLSAFTVDNKGNQIYVFGQIEETPPFSDFPALKDPGGGAYYQVGAHNYLSEASFLMKLKPSLLNLTTSSQPPSGCNCTGTITVTPSCGSGNYSYEWSRGDVTPSISNVCPGNYTVKVTDMNTLTDSVIKVNLPNPPTNVNAATFTASPDHCNKNDGTIRITNITGGPAPYQYSLNNAPYTATPSFSNLADGAYQVAVKDNDGCILQNSVVVSSAPGPDSIYTTLTPTACNQDNGMIVIDSIRKGSLPFTYSLDGGSALATNSFTGLAANRYQLSTSDVAGCTTSTWITLPMAQGPSAIQTQITDTHCDQAIGSLVVDAVTGGKSPYSYSLDNRSFQPGNLFSNLPAGNQSIYLQDANGCSYSTSFSIHNIPGPSKIDFTQKDALCGVPYGSILVNSVSGGAAPYLYSVDNSPFSGQDLLQELLPGKRVFTVKDAYGCTLKDSTEILQSEQLKIQVSPGDTLVCAADKIAFDASVLSTNKGVAFSWNGSPSPSPSFQASFYADTSVDVQAVDKDGCTATDIIRVKVHYCDSLLVKCVQFPNAFTPNDDGSNDTFGPHIGSCDIHSYELSVFNRWGQVVFQTTAPLHRWDGRQNGQSPISGTYIYTCTWTDALGVIRHLKGFVVLVR